MGAGLAGNNTNRGGDENVSKLQGWVLRVWSAVAVLLVLFPHFVVKRQGGVLDAGFGFLFTGPFERSWKVAAVVDTPLLLVMELVAAGLAAVGFFTAKGGGSKGES